MNKKQCRSVLALAALLLGAFTRLWSDQLPTNSGAINVKLAPYNAVGDGVTDDTAAIQAAIAANVNRGSIIYFPSGTYLVSNSLEWKNSSGLWAANLSFEGQSRTGTVIKLQSGATGFSGTAPKAVIATGSTLNGAPSSTPSGGGVEAFRNSFYDLTVDTGSNNTNAVGIDWICNNRGTIRNVTIKSSDSTLRGNAGILLTRAYPGPCLIENVAVDGFNYGINAGQVQYGITVYNVTLTNQKTYGINVTSNVFSIDTVTSTNSVPVISASSTTGQLTLLNGTFVGGSGTKSAIEAATGAKMYLRDVNSSGYQSTLKIGTTVQPGSSITEYVSHPIKELFPSPQTSLNLPIEDSPAVFYSGSFATDWASVTDYAGGNPNDVNDDTSAIQAAMNSGKPIVYFPRGTNASSAYYIDNTITIPSTVKRVVGMENYIKVKTSSTNFSPGVPVFKVQGGVSTDTITIERFWAVTDVAGALDGGNWIEQDSPRTLYLRDLTLGGTNLGFRNKPAAGKLFVDDCYVSVHLDYPQKFWARQLNTEDKQGVTNAGGDLWILGLKTETDFTAITTTAGGYSELLGAFLMPGVNTTGWPVNPGFINNESNQSLVYTVYGSNSDDDYQVQVKEIRNGVTKTLLHTDMLLSGSNRAFMPLYVGYRNLDTLLVVGNLTLSAADQAISNRLTALGCNVVTVKDSTSTAADATGKGLVVISGSVLSGSVTNKFRTVTVPVICMDPFVYDDMSMTDTPTSNYGWSTSQTSISITNPTHPMAAGLSGTNAVYTVAGSVGYGKPNANAVNIATVVGSSTLISIFGYDTGTTMFGSLVAPARRVGLFIGENSEGASLTANGGALFDAAVIWAVGP